MSTTDAPSTGISTIRETNSTDYVFPSWFWNPSTTDEERHHWFCQERTFRQAMSQDTPWARGVEKQLEREQRRLEAKPGTVDVSNYR